MITVRPSSERGRSSTGWLHSAHSFSFGDYFDLRHQGHGNLLVLNDDTVAPGKGFGTHGHRDMEIVSYVLEGALAHQDNLHERTGQGPVTTTASKPPDPDPAAAPTGILRPGDVQRMSAGWGVRHSEFNALHDQPTHFLQIWIKPLFTGIRPSYTQKHFPPADRRGRLARIASRRGDDGSVSMNGDASIWAGLFDGDETATQVLNPERLAYVHVARGTLQVNGVVVSGGDGALLDGESTLTLHDGSNAEVLVFDLARR
jgi:redox-sensitive bicupin YhaK (pirin superfamily)